MSRFDSHASSVWKRAHVGKAVAAALLACALVPFSAAWAEEAAPLDEAVLSEGAVDADIWEGAPSDWVSPVTISTSQEGLDAGQVRVDVTGTNDSPYIIRGVDLSLALPAGVRVVDGQAAAHADEIAPWESVHIQAVLADAAVPVAGTSNPKALASTGDATANGPLVGLVLVAVAGGAVLLAWRRGRRWASSTLSVLVAVALVVGLAPAFPSVAVAEEAGEAEGADEVSQSATLTAHAALPLGGQTYELSAFMDVASTGDLGIEARLSADASVAQGATSAHVTIVSDQSLADQVDASSVKLDYALANWSVVALDRVSDNRLDMTIEGPASEDETDGSVILDERAFANVGTAGQCAIPVEQVVARLEDADPSAGEGYRADLGAFVLPVSIGCAEFMPGADASAFSLPANPAIGVTNVACEAGGHEALVTLAVPGANLVEQFDALDQALTEGGMLIGTKAVNCGDITATAQDVERAEAMPYETTSLEYVDATLFASARVVGVTAPAGEGGPLALECAATVGVADVGAVDLRRVQPGDIVIHHVVADKLVLDEPAVVTGPDTFSFSLFLEGDSAQLLWETFKDADADGIVLDDLQGSTDLLDFMITPCEVIVNGGGVANAWGIPESSATAAISYDYSGTAGDAAAMASLGAAETRTRVDEPDYETVEKSLQATNEALHAIGEFVHGFMGEEPNPGDLISSLGSLFGFVGTVVGAVGKPTYTLEDVVDRLDTIQSGVRTLGTKLSGLSTQLSSIEIRDAYRMQVQSLLEYTDVLSASGGTSNYVYNTLKSLDLSADVPYDRLSAEDKQKLTDLTKHTTRKAKTLGYPNTSSLVTKLGRMIIGQGSLSATGVCDLYFDYVGTYYNWEPETYEARKTFMAYVSKAYIYGYSAAMCELNVAMAQALEKGDDAEVTSYRESIDDLIAQADKVVSIMEGTYDGEGNHVKSPLCERMEDRPDGKVLNLVTGELFAKGSSAGGFNTQAFSVEDSNLNTALNKREVDSFHYNSLNTHMTAAQFEEMKNRLNANGLAASIAKELDKQGISYGKEDAWNLTKSDKQRAWSTTGEQRFKYVVSVDGSRRTTCNRFANKHAYQYVGDVFDIRTGITEPGVALCDYYTLYWFFRGWGVNFVIYDYKAVSPDA